MSKPPTAHVLNVFRVALRAQFGKKVNLDLIQAIMERENIVTGLADLAAMEGPEDEEVLQILQGQAAANLTTIAKIRATIAADKGGPAAAKEIFDHELCFLKWQASEHRTLNPKPTIVLQAVMHLSDSKRNGSAPNLPNVAEVEELIRAVIYGEGDPQRRRSFIAGIKRIAEQHPNHKKAVTAQREKEWIREWVLSTFPGDDLKVRNICKEWGIPLAPGKGKSKSSP